MTDTSMAIKADDGVTHERVTTVPEDSGKSIAGRSDGRGKSVLGGDESHEPEPYPLHAKLLAIAKAVQPTNAATLAEFEALLTEKAPGINAQDGSGKTALHIAIEQGLNTESRCLVDAGANVAIGDHEGQQPLYLACLEGNTELVDLLLSKGAIVNAASNDGETPFAAACRQGYTGIVNILFDRKANTMTSDEDNWTPLHWASWQNLEETVQRLLGLDTSNIDAIEAIVKWTPLNAAAYRGHERIVSLLLKSNANLYIEDRSDWTPLMTATRMQYPSVVKMILGHKAGWKEDYLEIRDNENRTPLHVASMEGYYEILSQLIDAGANVNATDDDGMTPLHLASGARVKPNLRSGKYTAFGETSSTADPERYFHIVDLLLRRKADPSIVDGNHETALHRASAIGDQARINVLLKSMKSEDLSWRSWKDSPVHSALGGNDPQTAMESLLARQEIKEASFWEYDGRFQVIKEVMKHFTPEPILTLISNEEPKDGWQIPPEGFQKSGLIKWAAQKRLPYILSNEIDVSGSREKVYKMVDEALQETCELENTKELESEASCEKLLKVMAILITNSARTTTNREFIQQASKLVEESLSRSKAMGGKRRKQPKKGQEHLSGVESLPIGEGSSAVHNPESHGTKGLQTHTSILDKHLDILSKLRDILKDPPFEQASRTYKDEVDYNDPVPGPNHHLIVEKTEATVVAFYKGESISGRIRRNRGVQEIVYGQGPTKVVEGCIRDLIGYKGKWGMPFADTLYANENLKLTWVHLPSTNLVWMNDLLTKIMSKPAFTNEDYSDARSFFRDSWVEVPDGTSHSRMMRPQFLTQGGEPDNNPDPGSGSLRNKDKDKRFPASAIYMPYLVYSTYCRNWEQGQGVESQNLRNAHAYYDSLIQSYEGQQQHGSPTIDEWYYQFAPDDEEAKEDQKKRNESQVVSKYLQEKEYVSDVLKRNQWTVIRVNQLWIWTISTNWIITAASFPFDKSPDALVDEILNLLNRQADSGGGRAQPASADHLLTEIIDYCVGSYERTPEDNNKISIGQTFSRYINSISRKETTLFDEFLKMSRENGQSADPGRVIANSEVSKKMDPRLYIDYIGPEAKNLCSNIKDVLDELSILRSVVRYQQIVQRGIEGTKVDESRLSSTYVMKNLEELDDISERIKSAVNTTLSLQQSELANSQATEATKQGNTVMTFTFATVLFLPLSFLSSLFALDVASFQEAPAWAFYVIFFVSAGISLILGFGVFYWDNIKRFMKLRFDSEEKAYQGDSRRTPGDLNLPERGQDGNDDEGRGDRPPIIASKIEATKPGFRGLFRRHIQRAKAEGIENNAIV